MVAALRPTWDNARWYQTNLAELCQLRHPCIVTVFGGSLVGGEPVLVLERMVAPLHCFLSSSRDGLRYDSAVRIVSGLAAAARAPTDQPIRLLRLMRSAQRSPQLLRSACRAGPFPP